MNLPNKITISRICLIPFVIFFYLADFIPYGKLVAALIFGIAAITDNIDGRIARKRNLVTDLGKFLDPIADKVLVMSGLLLITAWPVQGAGVSQAIPAIWPIWLGILCVTIILARELIISAFRQIAATKNLVLAADKSGKIKAAIQDVTIFLYMIYAFLVSEFWTAIEGTANTVICIVLIVCLVVSTILTISSGIGYIVKNRHVLKEDPKKQEKTVKYDGLIPDVLREFFDEGLISMKKVASRFNIDEQRATKIVKDMTVLGYISDEGDEREILISQKDYEDIFGKQ